MILQSIRLHPFAGIADTTFDFKEGLTVICGPNEHGKSTVANALKFSLFIPTSLTPAKRRDELKNVLPVKGGDTVRLTLRFSHQNIKYTLMKQWAAASSAELTSEGGMTITDSSLVQEKLLSMLPVNRAVTEQVLIASQSQLAAAVETISHNCDIQSSLSDKLRAAIINGGGISATRLEDTIIRRIKGFFDRWDEQSGTIEGGAGRGLSNRWQKEVGYIAQAWYQWEETKQTEQKVLTYDRESNELQTQLNECNIALQQLSAFLDTHKAAYDAVNKRIALENDLDKVKRALDEFTKDALRWPTAILEKASAEEALKAVQKEIDDLNEELGNALLKAKAVSDKQKLTQVNELKRKIQEAETGLKQVLKIEDVDLAAAKQCERNIANCKAKIDGQKLLLEIDSSVQDQIAVTHSGDVVEKITLVPGESIIKSISGGVAFEWKGVFFKLQSANADIKTLEADLDAAKKDLQKILDKYSESSLQSLNDAAQKYIKSLKDLETANSNFSAALGNEEYKDLAARCAQVDELPGTRDCNVLQELMFAKNTLKGESNTKLRSLETEIAALQIKYESQEKLDDRRLNDKQVFNAKKTELDALPLLPEGYETAQLFQEDYQSNQNLKNKWSEKKHQVEIQVKSLTEPELTMQEAGEQTEIAQSRFEKALAEGKAFKKIQAALSEILASADANAYQPLHQKTETYLEKLSLGRFNKIPFDLTHPQQLEGNGVSLPVHLLSKGTKDILALSLRLAAADVYLQDDKGFIVMDDPLVDMDTPRRQASINVLHEFSQRHQTVIFTCHESHAELLLMQNEDLATIERNSPGD